MTDQETRSDRMKGLISKQLDMASSFLEAGFLHEAEDLMANAEKKMKRLGMKIPKVHE